MALNDRVDDVHARTHMTGAHPTKPATSENRSGRPTLRVVPDHTHTPNKPHPGGPAGHLRDAVNAVAEHPVTGAHPPTVADAARRIWLPADEVRHGLAGQLAAAAAGIAQVIGLAVCWAFAHVFFADKTRAAAFTLLLLASLAVFGIASHI